MAAPDDHEDLWGFRREKKKNGEEEEEEEEEKKDIKVEWSDHLLGVLEVQKSNFGFAKSALCFLSSLFF